MALKWTKTSGAPPSGVMKPYPFSPLNHFTVPCATVVLLLRWERIDGRPCAGHRAAAVFDVPPRSGAPCEAHRRGPVRMTPAAVDVRAPVNVRELLLQPGATLALRARGAYHGQGGSAPERPAPSRAGPRGGTAPCRRPVALGGRVMGTLGRTGRGRRARSGSPVEEA